MSVLLYMIRVPRATVDRCLHVHSPFCAFIASSLFWWLKWDMASVGDLVKGAGGGGSFVGLCGQESS